jgi:hypothetical protein
VFERFTDRARRVVVLAQEEARLLNHNYIGTEHLLLGLIHEGEGVAAKALESLGISLEAVRNQVEETIGQGGSAPSGHIPFTARAKKVLELSLREAIEIGHNYIGTEHILLGLIREGEGVAAQVLVKLGADFGRVRQQVIQLLSGYQRGPADLPSSAAFGAGQLARAGMEIRPAGASATSHCSFCGRDLWEVDHYVASPTATICADCVSASSEVMNRVTSAESEWGPVYLPPRVFGPEPADPAAIAEIERAFTTLFDDSATDEARAEALEDGGSLLAVLAEARARHPSVGPVQVRVERVRFLDERHARARFVILLGRGGPSFDGEAVAADGRWQVRRETFCQVMAMAGVRCPPQSREPQ